MSSVARSFGAGGGGAHQLVELHPARVGLGGDHRVADVDEILLGQAEDLLPDLLGFLLGRKHHCDQVGHVLSSRGVRTAGGRNHRNSLR
jgi:hypothetical protein